MVSVDVNCDMGEGFGPWPMGHDAALMQYITSANIACGFHAGDPAIMRETVRLALKHHVAIGAHPGFPDLQGFGRREINMSPEDVFVMVLYQIGALQAIAKAEGGTVHHVKPHGALYNMAARDRKLADAIARATQQSGTEMVLYGLSGSALIEAGNAIGLRTASEVFADRTYRDDGSLTPRNQINALIEDAGQAVAQAFQMVQKQSVISATGRRVDLVSETLCLHGDGAHALEFAIAIHGAFREAGIEMKAL
ncbi:MAG: LamB/YcsF family protein [Saprospiraceae bacterium]|nr:LamB/YcsF family protein [Saprospiraceae bacterium]